MIKKKFKSTAEIYTYPALNPTNSNSGTSGAGGGTGGNGGGTGGGSTGSGGGSWWDSDNTGSLIDNLFDFLGGLFSNQNKQPYPMPQQPAVNPLFIYGLGSLLLVIVLALTFKIVK